MDIIFYCPHCDQKIEAPSPYAGKNIICPNCKAEIIVPFTSSKNTNIQLETEKEDKNASISEAKIEESDLNSVQKIQSSQNSNKEPAPFNEVVYTLLGIFFGLFGTHNFYKRQYFSGIIRISSFFVFIAAVLLTNIQGSKSGNTLFVLREIFLLIQIISLILVIVELGLQREDSQK